jgi:hypothetical protein
MEMNQLGSVTHDGLVIGQRISGNPIPVIHRAIGLPEAAILTEQNEYVFIENETEIVKTYTANETPMGISCLVLSSDSLNNDGKHGVLHSSRLGEDCFISNHLEDGRALYVLESLNLRFIKKKTDKSSSGYHCLVFPTVSMTLTQFIQQSSNGNNWHVCHAVAGAEDNDLGSSDWENISENFTIDPGMVKLIRLLNSYACSLNGPTLGLANRIKSVIRESQSFTQLINSEDLAFCIYAFLHHLNETLKNESVSSLIFVESLMDVIDSRYNISDKWTIVNITELVNKVFAIRFDCS